MAPRIPLPKQRSEAFKSDKDYNRKVKIEIPPDENEGAEDETRPISNRDNPEM